jgi:broad specificity phosphatase PhoE
MTVLHLIRHGRASALETDYDQLHVHGEAQARLLGEHLGRGREAFDAVYVGPHKRQLDTLRLMREGAQPAGVSWPEATLLEGLAEGPFEVLFKVYLRPRIKLDAELQRGMAQLKEAADELARQLALEAMFHRMVTLWRAGEVLGDDLEPAAAFTARVLDAQQRIAAQQGAGKRVAVVTSNGVIGELLEAVARVAPPEGQSRHRFYNTSVTILELAGSGHALHALNTTAHLSDPELLTFL